MPEESNNEKKKQKIMLLIGLVTLLLAVLGATYAFFQINTDTESSNTAITGSTPEKSLVTLQGLTSNLHLNISASDMSYDNRTKEYYATDGEGKAYEENETDGTKTIANVSLEGGEATTKYSCTAKLTVSRVTVPEEEATDVKDMIEVLQPGDMILQFKGNIISEKLDLSELKTTGSKEYNLSFKVTGNTPEEIQAYIKLVNKETSQNYLAGSKLNIDINTSDLQCEVFIDSFNYMKIDWNSFDDYRTKIKNVNFVDNTDTSKSTASWDISDTSQGTKAKSVMAWVEPVENESESYNLYIGSEKMIKAISLEEAFCGMTQIEVINFNDKLDTSETTSLEMTFSGYCGVDEVDMNLRKINGIENWDTSKVTTLEHTFYGLKELQELNVSKWDTSNVTSFYELFEWDSKLEKLDLSNWNLYNANDTVGMFRNCSSLKLIDLRGSVSIPLFDHYNNWIQQMFVGVPNDAIWVVNNEELKNRLSTTIFRAFLQFNGSIMTVEEYEQQGG